MVAPRYGARWIQSPPDTVTPRAITKSVRPLTKLDTMNINATRKKCLSVSALALLALLNVVACGKENEASATQEISWGGPKNISMLPIIAEQNGFFRKENLSTKYNYLQTGKITLDAVVRGDIQFGVIVEATVAFAGFQNISGVRIIAVNQEKRDDAIVARKDRGVKTPADLVGKRLGVTQGTNSQMYAYRLLEANHIAPRSVEIVNLTPPAIVAALNNGEIDAGSVWQPFRYYLNQQLGDKATNLENNGIYRGYALIAVKESWAREHPKAVENFIKALIDAEGYSHQHQKETIQALAKEIDLTPELLGKIWDEYSLSVSMPQTLADTIAQEGRWIIGNVDGFVGKQLPNYAALIDNTPLARIAKERVQ